MSGLRGQQEIDDVLVPLIEQLDADVPKGEVDDEVIRDFNRRGRQALRARLAGKVADEELTELCDQLTYQLLVLFAVRELGWPPVDQLRQE